jgi:hypothetical protein
MSLAPFHRLLGSSIGDRTEELICDKQVGDEVIDGVAGRGADAPPDLRRGQR